VDVTYFEKKPSKFDEEEPEKFVIPENSQCYPIPPEDIVKKLPCPINKQMRGVC